VTHFKGPERRFARYSRWLKENRMRRAVFCLIALTAIAGLAQAGTADVYSYKDANGQTHYTDRWRPGAVLVKSGVPTALRPAAPAPGTPANTGTDQQRIGENLKNAADTRAMNADLAKKRAEQCKAATEQYERLIAARRVTKRDDKGNQIFLSDAEADAQRVRARQERDTLCAGAGSIR
jgi:hypothetical protein